MEPLTDEEREAKIVTLEAEQENKEAEKEEQKEAEKSEHEDKYFVVNGGTCVCNKAQDVNKEAEIVVSKNSKLIINDDAKKFAATEEDIKMKPASSTFGKCILQPTSSDYLACMPAFLPKWEKAYDKKTVDGKKILTELSTLQCTIGGKIEIKKHGQEYSVVKEHAENTNAAEQALVNPAVPMPVLEMKYPSVSSIVLKEITGRARFGEIKSEGSGVEKIRIRLNEELTFKANLNKGNEKLTSWVIYEMKMGKVAAKFITLEQKGTSFQNTFSTLGTYRVEGYGKPKTPTYNDGKNDKNYTDCSIDVEVIVNKLDGNVLLPKEASNFTRVKGKENTLRQGTPATFEAKFLLDPNKEELGNLQIYATDASGNVVASGTQSGNTFTFTPTNSKAKYTILAKYTNLEGQVETQTFSATTESIYVNSISHADEVIRPETPMNFKVVNTQFKTTGSLTNEEAATVKWNLNGQLVGTGSCVEIPGVYFLKEGKYVVEAYVNTANASVTSGSNKDNEKDDWHFEVKKNDVLRFGYIGGVPKVGKTTQLKADKFIMPPIAGEKVVWNVFGKILENTSYNNPVIDITPGYARKENVTCKINHQKGVSQSIEIAEAEILDAHFTDSNGIKIENASWEQTVYIYIDAKHLSGEEINIKVYDQDYFDGNDHVGSVNTKSYNGKPLEFKLDKTVKDKTGSNGKLYFKVSAPHLTLKNSDTRFPSEKLTVEDAINFENPIIGEENGLKKHYLVDYDDISWFYVNTTGIKDTTKLKIGVWQYNKEKELVHILALKHTLDKDGVLKAKIEWNKIQKIKTSRIVYIRVKDENDKILCDSVSKMNEAALTLQFTPTAVKMVENKAAMVVGTSPVVKIEKEKQVIFPLLVKPENDKGKKWGKTRNWTANQGANMTTFNANRDGGKRKHAARDLYTNELESVVAICAGVVLDVSDFYCKTHEVVISHKTKDGRSFIIRYGELDPKSIKVVVGQEIEQEHEIGKTGKLLKYLPVKKEYTPLMKIGEDIVYMLHFEHFTGAKGLDIKESLSNSTKPYSRRSDLIDSLSILQEGYRNSFGVVSQIVKNDDDGFTEHDARLVLMKIYDLYGKEMAQTIESMYRWECKHFKSEQYKNCGAPGMEVSGNNSAPNYGWDGTLYLSHPEYKPVGLWEAFEGKGKSGQGGNAQINDKKKKYIKFPSVEAGMMYVVNFIQRHDNNIGRWHSLDATIQNNYKKDIKTAVPRIVNSF